MKSLDCTVIIPLKDNPSRTIFTLQNSIFPELEYIFADGSESNENEVLFKNIHLENVRYVRFPPDANQVIFSKKMSDAAQFSKTKYTCTIDQGDLLSLSGIKASIQCLDSDVGISAACGRIYAASRLGTYLSGLHRVNASEHLSGIASAEAIKKLKNRYGLLWYSIMRSKNFSEIHFNLFQRSLIHPEREIFPTIFLLSRGIYAAHQSPQLLRISYSPRKWTKQDSDFHDPKALLDIKGKTSQFGELCYEIIGVDPHLVADISEPFFMTVFRQRQRQWLGPQFLARLMPNNEMVRKFPFLGSLEVYCEYFLKMIFPSKPSKMLFSLLRLHRLSNWEKIAERIGE